MSQPSPLAPARQRAHALASAGDLVGARAILERAVELGRENLAEDDPDVLLTAYELGTVLQQADDPVAARRVLEEAYAAGQWRLGDADALMLQISHGIGVVAEELGNRHEARKAFGRVAELGAATLGDGHWAVARARAYLGQDPVRHERVAPPSQVAPTAQAPSVPGTAVGAPVHGSGSPPPDRTDGPDSPLTPQAHTPGYGPSSPLVTRAGAPDHGPGRSPTTQGSARDHRQGTPLTTQGSAPGYGPGTPPTPADAHGYGPGLPPTAQRGDPDSRHGTPPTTPWAGAPAASVPQQAAMQQPASDGAPAQPPGVTGAQGAPFASTSAYAPPPQANSAYAPPPQANSAYASPPATNGAGPAQPATNNAHPAASTSDTPHGEPPLAGTATVQPPSAVNQQLWTSPTASARRGNGIEEPTVAHPIINPRGGSAVPVGPHQPVTPSIGGTGQAAYPHSEPQRMGGVPPHSPGPAPVDASASYGRKGLGIFAAVAAVLASVIAVAALVFVLATRSGDAGGGGDVPTVAGAAPTGVELLDAGSRITVTWQDPSPGTVSFVVSMGRPGQQLKPAGTLSPGSTSFAMEGLNPALNYCFSVVAVYRADRVAPSPQVCTGRGSATPR